MNVVTVQIPEGPVSHVNPVYYVTFLSQMSAQSSDIDVESSFEITDASTVVQVIDWVLERLPENLLLAEVSAVSDEIDESGRAARIRVWSYMPDTAWAQKVGADYTY